MKVLAADGISPKGIELLQKEFEVVVKDKLPAEELLEIIPDFDALIVRSASKVTAEVIARAKKLKIIGRAGVGVDNIDIPAATAKGIIVINSPGGNTIAATEHTMAMMLAMSRNIPIANETMHKGEWNRKKYVGVELRGKTLGVVGMGRIGSGVAKRAMAFDMNVLAYDPYINEERAKALGVKVATFDEVIENSDFITVHMPLTKETKGMIAMEQMKKMKPGVRLVNCARGGIIDEADLAEALKQGLVAAAAIDVYTSDPPAEKGNPLLEAPNIVLTPHLGASTVEAQIGVSVDVAKGIIAALHGEPVATAVNMAPVSPQVMRVIAPYLTLAERLGGTIATRGDDRGRQRRLPSPRMDRSRICSTRRLSNRYRLCPKGLGYGGDSIARFPLANARMVCRLGDLGRQPRRRARPYRRIAFDLGMARRSTLGCRTTRFR